MYEQATEEIGSLKFVPKARRDNNHGLKAALKRDYGGPNTDAASNKKAREFAQNKDFQDLEEESVPPYQPTVTSPNRSPHMADLQLLDDNSFLYRKELELRPPDHPDRPDTLSKLSRALLMRVKQKADIRDLEECISLFRELLKLDLSPAAHPDRLDTLRNLVICLSMRFNQKGDIRDLEAGICLLRELLELRPAAHLDRPGILLSLSEALFMRFERKGDIQDLEESIGLLRKLLELGLVVYPDRPTPLIYLSSFLLTRFKQKGDSQDIEEVISLSQEALDLLPTSHPRRVRALEELADALSVRFKQKGNVRDLDKIINVTREALDISPCSKASDSFATTLFALEEIINLNREALDLPPPHPDRFKALNSLAIALSIRFEHVGNYQDLEESISLHREALGLQPPPHLDRFEVLNSLATALFTAFGQNGHLQDLEESILLLREALSCLPPSHSNRPVTLESLATTLFTRFQQKDEFENLEESILLRRKALDLRPPLHSVRIEALNSLASALSGRFEHKGSLEDLKESIGLYREALSLTPSSHPDHSASLHNLANALSARFKRTGAPEDSQESAALYREARYSLQPIFSGRSIPLKDPASSLSNSSMLEGTGLLRDEARIEVSKLQHQPLAQCMNEEPSNATLPEQIGLIDSRIKEHPEPGSILMGAKSELIGAMDVANFLEKERDTIHNALNQKLSGLGYSGEYILYAAFNEGLLRQGIEHPEVFLILNGDLTDDDGVISRDLSLIFSPHTTVLYMESRMLNLTPPNELRRPALSQEPSASPAPIHQLNSSIQSQSIGMSGASQPHEQGDQGSTGRTSRDNKDRTEHPDEEGDGEKQPDKGKGKAKEGDEVPNRYRRQLELRLRTPLRIDRAASKRSSDHSHEFNLNTTTNIELRSNRGGTDWNELAKGVVQDSLQRSPRNLPQDPLCSVSFDKITTSRGGTALHSLTALMVHFEATPSQTECEQLLPRPNRDTDIKISSETRTKGGGSTTLGPKPEVKLELGREKRILEESTRQAWSIQRHEFPKEDAYVVTVEYKLNGSQEVADEEFRPGPSAIFSYESDQTERSLRISVRAFWSLNLNPDSFKNRFRQLFKRPDSSHLIYANFFHKFSFSIDLQQLVQQGMDNDFWRGKNVDVHGDRFQDCRASESEFKAMSIEITRGKTSGKDAVVTVPLQRAVIAAIRGDAGKWNEGEQQVTSPDPDASI